MALEVVAAEVVINRIIMLFMLRVMRFRLLGDMPDSWNWCC